MYKEIAIVGSTASGKSDLAIELAKKLNCYILSLDSLSIYKEIDIVSAKPPKREREEVKHFGIDIIYPDEGFNAYIFSKLYKDVKELTKKDRKGLIVVGGSSFYLKSLLDGLSSISIDESVKNRVKVDMLNIESAFKKLKEIDLEFASSISNRDRYRIERGLSIFYQTNKAPTLAFRDSSKESQIESVEIFNIELDRDILRERIKARTQKMLELNLLDEVFYLENRYGRDIKPMKSIGVIESLDYFDGKLTLNGLFDKIVTNTYRLAKRQSTFNRTQFNNSISGDIESIKKVIMERYGN